MSSSVPPLELDQALREAGETGEHLRWSLLRHFSELIRDLTHAVDLPVPALQDAPDLEPDSAPPPAMEEESSPVPPSGVLALSEYGDEAALHEVRLEALHELETRSLAREEIVALWLDVVPFWGHPLALCIGVTVEGYRRILGFAEANLQEMDAMQHLIQDVLDRGLCVKKGLLWITPGLPGLSRLLTECLGAQVRHQHCQVYKCIQVTSLLPEEEQRRIRGAIKRAYAQPGARQAHADLLRIHATLVRQNRSAAQCLLQGLEHTLTVHQSGLAGRISPSLYTTRSIARTGCLLQQRVRGVRRWLPPQTRRAQIALLLLERELRMRRLAHASVLSVLRTALFANRETEPE